MVAPPAQAAGWVEPRFRRVQSDDGTRRVALTLDACGGGFDLRIAQALIDQRIKATIFLTALWIRNNPAGLKLLLDNRDLFAFENHGARHLPPILGSITMFGLPVAGTLDAVRREVEVGARAVRAATGSETHWYRGATARYSPEAIAEIERLGQRIAAYSLSADQGASLPAGVVAARIAKAQDGETIIGHINQPHRSSGDGIAQGVGELKRAGVVFVDLGTLGPHMAESRP